MVFLVAEFEFTPEADLAQRPAVRPGRPIEDLLIVKGVFRVPVRSPSNVHRPALHNTPASPEISTEYVYLDPGSVLIRPPTPDPPSPDPPSPVDARRRHARPGPASLVQSLSFERRPRPWHQPRAHGSGTAVFQRGAVEVDSSAYST